MGWLDRVARGAEFRSGTSGLANPAGWLVEAMRGGSRSAAGQPVTVDRALALAPFYAGVTLISETVGQLPFKVFRELEDGEKVTARDHRSWRMLHDQPNPVTPAHRFWSTVTAHLILWGNAFLEKERDPLTGLVTSLWIVEPQLITVQWDARLRMKRYTTSPYARPERSWTDETMLHITGWSSDGLMGMSVLHCREAFGAALARDEFEGSFYRRGVMPSLLVEHPGEVGTEGVRNLKNSIDAAHAGAGMGHGTIVLEEGAKAQRLTMPLKDLEFVASQQLTRTDIAVLLKIPPAYLGGTTGDSLTYATVESNQIQFAQNAIAPWTNTIAKAVSADPSIFPFRSWYGEHVLEGLMRADAKSRGEFYKLLDEVDAITVNEIRASENRPPLPDGDRTRSEREAEAQQAAAELAPVVEAEPAQPLPPGPAPRALNP
jgi:HK97 family phage portal protein